MSADIPFDAGRVFLGLEASDAPAVLSRLLDALLDTPGVDADRDAAALRQRLLVERDAPFASFGDGAMVIHLRHPGVAGVRMAMATLVRPVECGGEDVRWLCLVLAPRDRPVQEVRLIEQLRVLASDAAYREFVDRATDPAALADWLDERLRAVEGPLTARDLMRPSLGRIGPDDALPELVRRMAEHGVDCAGVTDDDRRLIGQVTATGLFTHGVPDFFRQLRSVSFIPEFDPFERYFAEEGGLHVRDVLETEFAALPPDATILEIVFELSVKGHTKVFVVENERLVGVVDRIRVLDRILSP